MAKSRYLKRYTSIRTIYVKDLIIYPYNMINQDNFEERQLQWITYRELYTTVIEVAYHNSENVPILVSGDTYSINLLILHI